MPASGSGGYPPYFVALGLFVALERGAFLAGRTSTASLISHLFLVHNARDAWVFGINPSFWSLATESQLYVLYPVLYLLRRGFGARAMVAMTLLISVAIRAAAEWRYVAEPPLWVALSPMTLWFDWTLGAYLCEVYLEGRRIFLRPRLFVVAMVAIIFAASLYRPTARHIFPMTSILFTALLEMAIWSPVRVSKLGGLLAKLGVCSYSVYLFHQPFMVPVSRWLETHWGMSPPARFASVAGLFLTLGWTIGPLLYRWLEVPSARIGKRQLRKPREMGAARTEPAFAGVTAQEKRPADPQ